jgi:C1A family cysteine protease
MTSEANKREITPYDFDDGLPEFIDWRKVGVVSSVKDQTKPVNCGSCWTFSAAGAIEGANAIKNGKLIDISNQQFLDCVFPEEDPCEGGTPYEIFEYTISHPAAPTDVYPFPYLGKG